MPVEVMLTARQNILWNEFHSHCNEMIVTKGGRKMFPKLEYTIRGLNPEKLYALVLHIELADESRFKFSGGEWMKSGKAEPHGEPKKVWHADGVMTGKQWMANAVCFDRVKITNNSEKNNASLIFLHSMHKYVPVLSIYESPSESPFSVPQASTQLVSTSRVPYMEFIAVTAYQNQTIINLKIEHNPFAKGFREGSQADRKRRSPSGESEESTSQISSPLPKKTRSVSPSPPLVSRVPAGPPMFPSPTPINPLFFTLPYFSHLAAGNMPMPGQFPFPFGFPCFSQMQFPPQPSPMRMDNVAVKKEDQEEIEPEVNVV